MAAIILANRVSPVTSPDAEFRVFQGINQVARIVIIAFGKASIPTVETLTAQAFTTMGEFALNSNELELDGLSAVMRAQITESLGYYDFSITQAEGLQPETITLENQCSSPVTFRLTRPGTPFQMVLTVDENNDGYINTAQIWTVYAIVKGITTSSVAVTNPDATVVLFARDNGDRFELEVSDVPVE